MKRKPRNTAVYDFDEGDVEPFSAKRAKSDKRKKLFESFFKGRHDSRGGGKNERNHCNDLTERLTKKTLCENLFAKETNASQSSSVSDLIETDDSESESNQRRKDLDMRFGGAVGVSTVFKDEDPLAEESRKVGIHGEELCLLDEKYSSPEFIFTAATIELKTQAFGAVKLPLSILKNFRSGSHEDGLFFIELDLTEHGAKFLQQHMGHSDNYALCHTIFSTFPDNNSQVEKIKQITSLSDGYKLIWRPEREYAGHHSEKCVNSIHRDRDAFDTGVNEHSLGDCIMHRSRASLNDWCDLIYPTEDDRDAVTVTQYDYLLLDPDQFLSDTVIDFYIKYLQSQIPDADKRRFYFYNSFFFRKLTEVDKNLQNVLEKSKSSFERVKRWTAGINIFDKDYLFIPIMQNAHWSLVIIGHPGYLSAGSDEGDFKAPVILHLDSLEGCHTCLEEPIRSYLVEAWRERSSHNEDSESLLTLKFVPLKVPQQTNYSDCGLFLLHYVELFIKEVLKKDSTNVAFHEWFNPADASSKRAHIQSLIQDLRAKKSAGEHVRPQHLTDTYAVRPSDVAQRAVSFGRDVCDVNKTTAIPSGNLFDQAFSMLVSHRQHHENDMQLSTFTRLGHDQVEFGVEVVGERHHFCRCCQHVSFDELDTFSLLQQGAAVNHVRPILMPFCTHVEDNCVVKSYDYVALDDSLEDFHTPVRETNNRPDGCTANIVDGSVKSNEVEDCFTSAISDPFVKSSTEFNVAFCCHYEDERIFDRRVCSTGKFSLDDTSSDRVFHTCSTSSGSSVEKPGRPLKEINAAIDESKAVVQESKDDSLGDPFVWLEGKEAVNIDFTNVTTQHTAVDSRQGIDTDHICMDGSKLQPVNEVAAANRSSEGRRLRKEEGTLVPTFKEGAICVSRSLSTDEDSCARNEGLDGPHHISADRGLMSKVVKGSRDGKRERASPRKNKQGELGSMVRRITRSTSKGKVKP